MAERTYDRSILESHPAFSIPEVSQELRARTEAAGWSDGLLERVLGLRRGTAEIDLWLDTGFPTTEMIEAWVPQEESVLRSTITTRQAGWNDNELIADLSRNSPEKVGDWDVIVQRGPNSFAQFRLQEHAYVIIAEDLRVGLGIVSRSMRNTIIDGERTSVHLMSGWRVRDGFRGLGLSNRLMQGAGPGNTWFGLVSYFYVRVDNQDRGWIDKVTTDMADWPEGWGTDSDQLTATVTHFNDPSNGRRSSRVRPAVEADLPRCRELINRTHEGLDLFRPYSLEYLEERLNDPSWGPKPHFYEAIYGWDDFRVVEIDGTVVACGGLWDRGRDIREVWRNPSTDERHTVAPTAVMDFGYAVDHHDAMVELLGHLLAETAELGRTSMMAALEFCPDVRASCDALASSRETRTLHVMPFVSPQLTIEAQVRRPYTDLAYW